jgi:hypothetical protein
MQPVTPRFTFAGRGGAVSSLECRYGWRVRGHRPLYLKVGKYARYRESDPHERVAQSVTVPKKARARLRVR